MMLKRLISAWKHSEMQNVIKFTKNKSRKNKFTKNKFRKHKPIKNSKLYVKKKAKYFQYHRW